MGRQHIFPIDTSSSATYWPTAPYEQGPQNLPNERPDIVKKSNDFPRYAHYEVQSLVIAAGQVISSTRDNHYRKGLGMPKLPEGIETVLLPKNLMA